MTNLKKVALAAVTTTLPFATTATAQSADMDLKFAGALEFSDSGTLFVGDNYTGAIFAFEMVDAPAPGQVAPVNIADIDVKIADALGVPSSAIAINDMAVHPVSAEIYVSVTRIGNFESAPAIMKVSQAGAIDVVDLESLAFEKQLLDHYPDQETTFRPRGLGQMPPLIRDEAKGNISLSSLAIMDMEFH